MKKEIMRNFESLTERELQTTNGGYSEMNYRRRAAKSLGRTSAADRKAAIGATAQLVGIAAIPAGMVSAPVGVGMSTVGILMGYGSM